VRFTLIFSGYSASEYAIVKMVASIPTKKPFKICEIHVNFQRVLLQRHCFSIVVDAVDGSVPVFREGSLVPSFLYTILLNISLTVEQGRSVPGKF
jgi:hypothetical protein